MAKSKVVLSVVVASLFVGSVGLAQDDISVAVTADFFSKYVWRGQTVVDDWVLQPGVSVGYKGLTGSIWGNLDMTDENGSAGEFTEVDLAIDYSGSVPGIDWLGYSVGAIYYDFPNTGFDATTELYWGVSADVPGSPSVTVYHDIDEADGAYVSLAVGHSFEKLGPLPVGVDLGASLGLGTGNYNRFYWGTSGAELNDLVLSAAFPFDVAGITVTPSLNYMVLLGSDVSDAAADDTVFFAGVGFAKEF